MKPLLVLILTFTIAVITLKGIQKQYDFALSSRIALSAMLLFTAVGHFAFTKGMTMMIPNVAPYKKTTRLPYGHHRGIGGHWIAYSKFAGSHRLVTDFVFYYSITGKYICSN